MEANKIIPHLYLGSRDNSYTHPKKFDLVINLDYPDNLAPNQKILEYKHKGVRIVNLGIDDFIKTKIIKTFDTLVKLIDLYLKQKRNVLVHCRMGVSRSASIVIAYLMWKYNLTYRDAYKFVKSQRDIISPNPGFISQLKEYRKILRKGEKRRE